MSCKSSYSLNLTIAGLLSLSCFVGPLYANPESGTVVSGSAIINQTDAKTVTINQNSDKAIINWQKFNIAAGETTQFIQPSSNAIILNRVTGGEMSKIFGRLNANGRVVLINGSGIYFGPTASINVASLVATTANITDNDFLSGNYHFIQAPDTATSVINEGNIQAAEGLVALVAPAVVNSGVINARLGKVVLAAGNEYTLDFYGDQLINFVASNKVTKTPVDQNGNVVRSAVSNTGSIFADGGKVLITANTAKDVLDNSIYMSGIVQARTAVEKNGVIILDGGDDSVVRLSGKLDVSGKTGNTKGGTVKVLGTKIELASATIDASGDSGGGTVLIGGNYQGSGSERKATTMKVDRNSVINASALTQGNGGQVVVWSDGLTDYQGTVWAIGGMNSGNGGNAEISGKTDLNFQGRVDLRAVNGQIGNLLLDPTSIIISNATSSMDGTVLNVDDLNNQLALANIILQSSVGDITVDAFVNWLSGTKLTLQSAHDIIFNQGVNAPSGGLILNAANNIAANAAINVSRFTLEAGNWEQIMPALPSFVTHDFQIKNNATFARFAGGDGTSGNPYLIQDIYGLQGIKSMSLLNKSYLLVNNIDASITAIWNAGAGFIPIGDSTNPFTGNLDGAGHAISNLYLSTTNKGKAGLFGYVEGTVANPVNIHNLALIETTIKLVYSILDTGNSFAIGALAGESHYTSFSNLYIGGLNLNVFDNIVGIASYIGGLVGSSSNDNFTNVFNGGAINASATSSTAGNYNAVGGLIGISTNSSINYGYNFGNISTSHYSYTGGLIGYDAGSYMNYVYNSGNIDAGNFVGGLLGYSNSSIIINASNSGSIDADYFVGGLLGYSNNSVIVIASNSGNIDAIYVVGGLIGRSDNSIISHSYNNGNISADGILPGGGVYTNVGGLIGYGYNSTISNAYNTGDVATPGIYSGGLIGYSDSNHLDNIYNIGDVSGDYYVGGLIGRGDNSSINYAYNTGNVSGNSLFGSLAGITDGATTIVNSFWLNSPGLPGCGSGDCSNASAKTATELMTASTYSGWNFDSIWTLVAGNTTPYFQWRYQTIAGQVTNNGTASSGQTVSVVANGQVLNSLNSLDMFVDPAHSNLAITDTQGNYTLFFYNGIFGANSLLLAYISDGTLTGNTVSLSSNVSANVTGLNIAANTLTVNLNNASNTQLLAAKGEATSDRILYNVAGQTLKVNTNIVFMTNTGTIYHLNDGDAIEANQIIFNGALAAEGNNTLTVNGPLASPDIDRDIRFNAPVTGGNHGPLVLNAVDVYLSNAMTIDADLTINADKNIYLNDSATIDVTGQIVLLAHNDIIFNGGPNGIIINSGNNIKLIANADHNSEGNFIFNCDVSNCVLPLITSNNHDITIEGVDYITPADLAFQINSGTRNVSFSFNAALNSNSVYLGNDSGGLSLTNTELAGITANKLIIATAGDIIVDGVSNLATEKLQGIELNAGQNITFTNSAGSTLPAIEAKRFTAKAVKDIMLNAAIHTNASGDAVILSSDRFINNAGSQAVETDVNGRFLIYSSTPYDNTFGGLASNNTAIWNTTYVEGATIEQTGNRYIFAYQPTLSITLSNATKTYGGTINLANYYQITGLMPTGPSGVYLADSYTPVLITEGASASANVGSYLVILDTSNLPAGYNVSHNTSILQVVPSPITGGEDVDPQNYNDVSSDTMPTALDIPAILKPKISEDSALLSSDVKIIICPKILDYLMPINFDAYSAFLQLRDTDGLCRKAS